MSKRGRYFVALWLLLILFPVVQSSFAQSSGSTEVKVRLLESLDSGQTKSGQEFSATIAEPVMSGKRVILAKGTAVRGHVTQVSPAGHAKAPASMGLILTNVVGTRGVNALQSDLLVVDGNSYGMRKAALTSEAASGNATAYLTGKKELVVPVDAELTFVINTRTLGIAPEPKATILEASMRNGRGNVAQKDVDQDAYDSLIFSERDQSIIRAYYRPHGEAGLPLAKRNGNLPPALQRQLQANNVLPAGIEKQAEPFPGDLERQLPNLPRGYSRALINGRAMTIDMNSRIIDVFVVF